MLGTCGPTCQCAMRAVVLRGITVRLLADIAITSVNGTERILTHAGFVEYYPGTLFVELVGCCPACEAMEINNRASIGSYYDHASWLVCLFVRSFAGRLVRYCPCDFSKILSPIFMKFGTDVLQNVRRIFNFVQWPCNSLPFLHHFIHVLA